MKLLIAITAIIIVTAAVASGITWSLLSGWLESKIQDAFKGLDGIWPGT